jgi:hypothetical protein
MKGGKLDVQVGGEVNEISLSVRENRCNDSELVHNTKVVGT